MNKNTQIYILGVAAGTLGASINGLINPLSRTDNIALVYLSGIVVIGLFIYKAIKKKEKKNE